MFFSALGRKIVVQLRSQGKAADLSRARGEQRRGGIGGGEEGECGAYVAVVRATAPGARGDRCL